MLNVNHVTKRFGGLTAVDEVSFGLEMGRILGLVGPNGSGKTTLFNCISGLFPPSSGRIVFQEKDITGLKPHRICRLGIGRTFQLVKPFHSLSVKENVILGLAFGHRDRPAGLRAQAMEILEFVGLSGKAENKAGGLILAERKKLEIARALATGPSLLLLDEVASGLTESESEGIIALLKEINERGLSLLIVEHVMAVIMSLSHRVVVLSDGRKIADGPPDEVANDQNVIDVYLGEPPTTQVEAGEPS
ncbi:MAG: ABC transporter ATP-binding protein [Deltaproteobacteria bacterium]|nr:ABC transporter ATP-binding protein [Deltaproteobacteria bacterium]